VGPDERASKTDGQSLQVNNFTRRRNDGESGTLKEFSEPLVNTG
jgi:hypothetical protein